MVRDVTVTINRAALIATESPNGLPLILATNAALPYKEYTTLAAVELDYISSTDAYKMAKALFDQSIDKIAILGILYVDGTDPVGDLTAALTTLIETENAWYFLLCTAHLSPSITELATNFIEAQNKMYVAASVDLALAGTLTGERTVVIYKVAITDQPDGAWVGQVARSLPGTITWKFKTLLGVAAETSLTKAVIDQLHTDGGNTYITALGRNYTSEGLTTNPGIYADVVRASDYLENEIVAAVFNLMLDTGKIPYTQDGINQVVGQVRNVFTSAADDGIISTDISGNGEFVITAPSITEVSVADKAARLLKDIVVTAILSNAIHDVEVTVNFVIEI